MQRQLLFNCSNQQHLIALNDSCNPILDTRLVTGRYYFRLIGLLFILATISISTTFAQTTYDISLDHTVDNPTATIGDIVEFSVVLSNLDGDEATGVVVVDSLSPCLIWDASLNPAPFSGTGGGTASYDQATHKITWNVADLTTAQVSHTLTFKAIVGCEGVSFSKAEVTAADGIDGDSDPNNSNYGEDDIATTCVSVPIRLCVTNADAIDLVADEGATDVNWYRVYDADNSNTLNAGDTVNLGSASTIEVIAGGTYFYESTYSGCAAGLCCPFTVEEACMDLALTKVVNTAVTPGPFSPGDPVTFTIEITNQGDVAADSITIYDYLPADLNLNDADWTVVNATDDSTAYQLLTVADGDLPSTGLLPNTSTSITIDATIDAAFSDTLLVNYAEIAGQTDEYGIDLVDRDSDSDSDRTNDSGGDPESDADDFINGNGLGAVGGSTDISDEDDHDPALLRIQQLSCAIEGTDLTCNGNDSGELTVTVNGVGTSYAYVWNDSDLNSTGETSNTKTLTGLAAGTYTTTITDNDGRTTTCSTIIAEPAAVAKYTWSVSGATFNTTPTTTDQTVDIDFSTTNAIISLTVEDADGCESTCEFNVTVNPKPACTISKTDITCNGNTDGTATAMPTGGLAGYSYKWSNDETTATITGLLATTYTVTVTDFNGCTNICSTTIGVPSVLDFSLSSTDVSCNGGSDGTITVDAIMGGTAPYEYSLDGGTFQSGLIFTGVVAATSYTVTAKDANG